jgi:hypothetical protein
MKKKFENGSDLDGYEDLKPEDQAKIDKAWEVGHVAEEDIPESARKPAEDDDGEEKPKKKTASRKKKNADADEDGDKPKPKRAPRKKAKVVNVCYFTSCSIEFLFTEG